MNFVSNRKPLDERLHDRDLEAALTLSLLNSSNERKDQAKGNSFPLQKKYHCVLLNLKMRMFFLFNFQGLPKFKF